MDGRIKLVLNEEGKRMLLPVEKEMIERQRNLLQEIKHELSRIESQIKERPKEVYLCILRHDDGRFKMICGCFYDKEEAERYAAGSPRITITKQSVI